MWGRHIPKKKVIKEIKKEIIEQVIENPIIPEIENDTITADIINTDITKKTKKRKKIVIDEEPV